MWNFNYFKTALIVCLLCIIGRGSALAQKETQYVFDSYTASKVTDKLGNKWSTSIALSNSELPADPTQTTGISRGVRFGATGTLTSDFEVSNVTKIVLEVSANNAGYSVAVKVGETLLTPNTVPVPKKNHTTFTFNSNEKLSGKIQVVVTKSDGGKSLYIGAVTVTTEEETNKCAVPVFDPVDGTTFTENLLVKATTTTENAKIVYTTDETEDPATDFPATGLTITNTTTIRAKAIDPTGTLEASDIVKVTYTKDKTDPGISFGTTEFTINLGDEFTKPTLVNPNELTATYSIVSNPADAITIDADGNVTINAAGTATITATTPETETYKAGTASYTLKVVDPNQKQATYTKITSVDEIEVGAQYIVVNETNKVALGLISSSNNGDCVAINITEVDGKNVATVESENSAANPYEITLAGTAASYTLQTAQCPKGIGWEGKTGNKLSTTTNTGWTISFTTQKNVTIANTASDNYEIRYNKDLNKFRAYKSTSGALVVQLYKKDKPVETGTHSIGEDGYATFYSEKAYKMPAGVTGGIVTETKATDETCGTLTIEYNYPEGSVVPAKTALLWKGEKNDYTFEYTTSEETAPAGNMLHGADAVNAEGKTEVAGENVKYYILSHNTNGDYGFFWAAADGKAVAYQAPYAFLAIDFGTTGLAPKMFSLDGNGGTTGITNVETSKNNTNGKIFSVTGAYVGTDKTRLPKGIYLIDGKKIAIK